MAQYRLSGGYIAVKRRRIISAPIRGAATLLWNPFAAVDAQCQVWYRNRLVPDRRIDPTLLRRHHHHGIGRGRRRDGTRNLRSRDDLLVLVPHTLLYHGVERLGAVIRGNILPGLVHPDQVIAK